MQRIVHIMVLLLGGISTTVFAALPEPLKTFPSLPTFYRENKFREIQTAFEIRSNLFLKGRHFQNWKPNKSQKDIFAEFKQIEEWRNHTWYSESTGEILISRPDFMVAQALLEKDYYRRPNLIAFNYNHLDNSYNASSIVLNGQRFLALESPRHKNLSAFFKLLQNYQVTQLIRLGSAEEPGYEPSVAYWINRLKIQKGSQIIQLPLAGTQKTLPIQYYTSENWLENEALDPKALLKLILSVRKNYDPQKGLLACHCTTGSARTGTFIAGFILLQEIDKQIAAGISIENLDISVEKVVLQLSLQRLQMVAKPAQYLSLYRLVDQYVASLKTQASKKP